MIFDSEMLDKKYYSIYIYIKKIILIKSYNSKSIINDKNNKYYKI